jgi:hypothetical protein
MLALTLALCGCSASHIIDQYAADYRDTVASAGDAQLLLNILRAKDDLPIHFYDLSNIHGSIQLTAGSAATVPFGLHTALAPNLFVPAVSVQNSPSFDLGTLDSQDFTKGMLSQVPVNTIKQLFDQGVDPRLLLMLFFSEYDGPNNDRFFNNTQCSLTTTFPYEHGCPLQMYSYLNEINKLAGGGKIFYAANERQELQAHTYQVLTPVGGPLYGVLASKDNLADMRQIDPKKYKLKGTQLYSISEPQLAICYHTKGKNRELRSLFPSRRFGDRICTEDEVVSSGGQRKSAGLVVRSPYEILQYLGQVLRFQEESEPNRCLTLNPAHEARGCDNGEVVFQVNSPVGTPVVATNYGGSWYAVYSRSCNKLGEESCDYSAQVMAILELLLNQNKAAKDIISTPRVQVVQ